MKKMITTGIAVTASVLVVFGFFGQELLTQAGIKDASLSALKLGQFDPTKLTLVIGSPIQHDLWRTFNSYRESAKSHDIAKLNSLSYKLSPTCAEALNGDEAKKAECNTLMDSVYFFTQDFQEKDFTNIAYDDKQAILSTKYMKVTADADPVKLVLYFTLDQNHPRVAGLRFCFGNEESRNQCVDSDKATRDANKNGWWDDIEYFLNR